MDSEKRKQTFKERLESFTKSESDHLDYNLILYDFPELYYAYLPKPETCGAIDAIIEQYCPDLSHGILDLGCGAGKVLALVGNKSGREIKKVGVDAHKAMIDYGVEQFGKAVELHVGDVKDFRYPHQFSLVLCIGTVLQYAYTNDDIRKMFKTIDQHLIPGGTVVLDIKNSATYIDGFKGLKVQLQEQTVDYGFFKGTKKPRCNFDLEKQLLQLYVDWEVDEPVQARFTDFCQFRMIFPQELSFMVESCGFKVQYLGDGYSSKSASFEQDRIVLIATKPSK